MGRHITRSEEQTVALGRQLAATLQGGEVIAFTGEMGAGKTAFCRGIAAGLGSQDPVHSPTYAVVNLYRGRIPFAHFDAWRTYGPEDLEEAGLYDYIDSGAVVAVEWSERAAGLLPTPLIRVDIRALDATGREITIEGAAEL